MRSEDEKKRIREDIHKALDLVLDINGLEMRKKECSGDLPTAFFRFDGHTASVDVHVYMSGWSLASNSEGGVCWHLERMGKILDWLEATKKALGN